MTTPTPTDIGARAGVAAGRGGVTGTDDAQNRPNIAIAAPNALL